MDFLRCDMNKMNKGISIMWYAPQDRIEQYKKICKKYGLDESNEEFWFNDDKEGKFFEFINELKENDIIVMNAN
jgi:hypothetical protein